MNDMAWRLWMSYGSAIRRPTSFAVLSVDTATPREILDELRREDPRGAMMLGELVVLDDDGRVTQESLDVLAATVRGMADDR